jgi:hypothetical protein
MVVEAHWELVHDPGYARRLEVRGFMARATRINSRDGSAPALDPADQLIYACAHLLLHHLQDWSLLWLLDLRLLVTRRGAGWDWSELVDRAERYKLAGRKRPRLWQQRECLLKRGGISRPRALDLHGNGDLSGAELGTRRICTRRSFTFERLYFHRGPICNIAMALAHTGWPPCITAGDLSGPGWLPSAVLDWADLLCRGWQRYDIMALDFRRVRCN